MILAGRFSDRLVSLRGITKVMKCVFLMNLGVISLLVISTSGCSILANALRRDVSPSPTVSPTQESTKEKTTPSITEEQPQVNDSPSPEPAPPRQAQTKVDALRQMNCREPSKTDYIYGSYQVGWTAKGDRYEGILKVNGDVGQMRLKFFNAAIDSEDLVDQTMVLATCPQGLILLGLNPRVPNTNNQHPFYVSDNILIRRETNGTITLVVVDDQGVISPLEIQEISN